MSFSLRVKYYLYKESSYKNLYESNKIFKEYGKYLHTYK